LRDSSRSKDPTTGEFEGFYFLDPDGNLLEVITYDSPEDERTRPLLTHDDVE